VIVNILEIEYEAKLANNKVKKTEANETITEFLKGVATLPVANRVLKFSKLKTFGSASGLE
jgi:hypothetical protein